MIVCLFGRTCSGKSTAGRSVAESLRIPIRSCGDEVRQRASAIGVGLGDLSDEVHRDVDRETREWADTKKDAIVEGRFVDAVLADRLDLLLVELHADVATRTLRSAQRAKSVAVDIARMDADDDVFRMRLYGTTRVLSFTRLDTTELTVKESCRWILSLLGRHCEGPD